MLWSRKPAPVHDRPRAVGLDLTASRARAAAATGRPLALDGPDDELPLFVACDRRSPAVGRAGLGLCRKSPHLVCSNFLPALGHPREWRAGRHALTAEVALGLAFDALRGPLAAESDALALALPVYLSAAQATLASAAAGRSRLALAGTAAGPLALAADLAPALLAGEPAADDPADGVVPLRRAAGGPGAVVVLDADEFALSALLVTVERDHARAVGAAVWPRLAVKLWKDRLIDAVSDRCVRLCRRDPRDSADAEQALFEQLDEALDRARAGQRLRLTVRTAHWFQDIVQAADEFEGQCAALARLAGESVRDFVCGIGLSGPPRAVWLTDAAGRLPGLVRAVHANTPEGTAVEILAPGAVARAAAGLGLRWRAGELPRAHLDGTIPLAEWRAGAPAQSAPRAGG